MDQIREEIGIDRVNQAFQAHKKAALRLRSEPLASRKQRLNALRNWIHNNRTSIHEAMYGDFQKASVEVDAIELFHVLNEIKFALNNLDQWVKPKKIDAPLTLLGTRSHIAYEPKGVCLIISPWNYPFSLAIGPLVSALAAGNCVMIKPSELTPRVSSLIRKMAEEIFDPQTVSVIEGGPEISQYLVSLPFDHIFFTGSPAIGKKVMKAAAENLTSVTLELGGKSPAIITDSANLRDAAQRVALAKFVNNGQTCIAPDYLLVDQKIAGQFTQSLINETQKLFADSTGDFEKSRSYCRIVNDKHFARVNELVQDALNRGAKLEFGGKVDAASRFIHPMVLSHIPLQARIMEEEIFGPVLPIVTYDTIENPINIINSKPKPLALYVFTKNRKIRKQIIQATSSGAVCVNDCAMHFFHHHLPFGGVNSSGIGKSHGYFGFLAFSNEKPVLKQKSGLTTTRAFHPPYTALSKKIMDWFLKLF